MLNLFLNLQVSFAINPKCPENECLNFTLVHVEQRGRTDTLHHLWSFSKTFPTLFYARTELDSILTINWTELLSGNHSQSISFNKKPQYFAAVIISKVLLIVCIVKKNSNSKSNQCFFTF